MKKKLASITALSLALVMTLSACGNNNTKTPSTSADGGTSTSAQAPSQTGTYPGNKNITLYCGYSAVRFSVLPVPSKMLRAPLVGCYGIKCWRVPIPMDIAFFSSTAPM